MYVLDAAYGKMKLTMEWVRAIRDTRDSLPCPMVCVCVCSGVCMCVHVCEMVCVCVCMCVQWCVYVCVWVPVNFAGALGFFSWVVYVTQC